jgi:hypothetical protein
LPNRGSSAGASTAPALENITKIGIAEIEPNPVQPRRVFEPEKLQELVNSIRVNGIIQPIIVRPNGNRYQLVAGERRWRAAKLAGLESVPVVVQDIPDDRLLEITLVENIQRENLNPLEEAGGVVTDPWGQPLDCPLDTITPVAWVGYANATLADLIGPLLREVLHDHVGR